MAMYEDGGVTFAQEQFDKSRKRREVNRVIKKEKVTVSLLANSTARIENLVRASLFLSTLIALGGTDIFLMADTVLF